MPASAQATAPVARCRAGNLDADCPGGDASVDGTPASPGGAAPRDGPVVTAADAGRPWASPDAAVFHHRAAVPADVRVRLARPDGVLRAGSDYRSAPGMSSREPGPAVAPAWAGAAEPAAPGQSGDLQPGAATWEARFAPLAAASPGAAVQPARACRRAAPRLRAFLPGSHRPARRFPVRRLPVARSQAQAARPPPRRVPRRSVPAPARTFPTPQARGRTRLRQPQAAQAVRPAVLPISPGAAAATQVRQAWPVRVPFHPASCPLPRPACRQTTRSTER